MDINKGRGAGGRIAPPRDSALPSASPARRRRSLMRLTSIEQSILMDECRTDLVTSQSRDHRALPWRSGIGQ